MAAPVVADAAIRLRGVGKRFVGDGQSVQALEGIDLDIGAGEFVSLLGPSGCGKSSLLRVIGGLLDHDTGTVAVGGEPPGRARRHKRFGLVPQTPALLPWRSVRRNVALLEEVNRRGADHESLSAAEVDALLDRVGLAGFADALPGELSGGMQQRVALVRAFALGAPVLLMDEPFSALDEITRSDMRYLLLDLWERRRTTVVFVTHSVPEAAVLSDRVVVMSPRPGRVLAEIEVELPRPRTAAVEDSDGFADQVARIRHVLREGMEP